MMSIQFTRLAAAALLMGVTAMPAFAADPVRGKMLYNNTNGAPLSCATAGACHGPDPLQNNNNIRKGTTGAFILNTINSESAMTFLKPYVSATDADDIAAYIVNPASGTPSPAATLSTATLAFGNQVVNTSSVTMSATLRNTGSANLVLASVSVGGTNAADFTRSGTCAAALTLAPTQTCSVDVVFKPAALGARSATVTVAHNAAPASSTLNLSGSGVSAPAPAVALSAMSIAFANQTVGTTSAPRTVSISNTGTSNLALGSITTTGSNAAEFGASNCSGTSLAPGASCTVSVTFTPAAATARTATLNIPSNAAGSPHGVALSGTGTLAPAPAVTLNPASLAFGNQTVNTTSASKSITLSNTGNAALGLTSISITGAGFASSHNCPASLAAGANCSIGVTFTPAAAVAYAASVAVVSSAAGSPHSVGLTGTGTPSVPVAPQVTLTPLAVDFGTLALNTASTKHSVTLSNSGTGPLSLTALAIAGANAGDFAQTNNCPIGGTLVAGASCAISLTFTPTAIGARAAGMTVTSNAPGAPSVDLKGTGVVQAAAQAQVAPTALTFRSMRVGRTSDSQRVRIRNTGTTPLMLGSITVTGDYTERHECPTSLAAGAVCEIKVRFKPTAVGSRLGELAIASNALGSPHAVKLSGTGVIKRERDDDDEDECEDDESSCSTARAPIGRRRD